MRVAVVLVSASLLAGPAGAGGLPATVPIAGVEPCGADGLRLPGSNGCVRLDGQIRTETALRLGGGPRTSLRTRVEGRVNGDLRVPTELGPLRLYGSLRARRGD